MKKFEYKIKDEIGIHARPAGLLVKTAGRFQSEIILKNNDNGKTADAKKLFAVMGLGAKCGNVIDVSLSGTDEDEACTAIENFFKETL